VNAVWSFWTKPFFADRECGWFSHWYSDWHHWLAWGLSVYAAARHYPETSLVTDDAGARILVDGLRLPFRHVSTALNRLKGEDPQWWALGKIEAYRRQPTPFVHIDADVFLWLPLRPELEHADVFAQNPETIVPGASCYRPADLDGAIRQSGSGWLPREWNAHGTAGTRAECCGVFGGNRVDFIRHYARAAVRLVTDPENRRALENLPGRNGHMILVEQYLLTACYEFHRARPRSPYRGIQMRYIFDTIEEACRPERAAQAGFTHLASTAKGNARVCAHVEQRVRRDLPRYYERCIALTRAAQRA